MHILKDDKQKGFTLVELMIAIAIGLFLTLGVLQIFSSTKQTNRMQENLSRMQENARFAMMFLIEDIRQAGYWGGGCVTDVIDGTQNYISSASPSGLKSEMKGAVYGGVKDGVEFLRLRGLFDQAGQSASVAMVSTTSPFAKVKQPFNTKVGNAMLITDCNTAALYQITSIASTAGPAYNLYRASPANVANGTHTNINFNADKVRIYSFGNTDIHREYKIKVDAVNNKYSLTRKIGAIDDELVSDVEKIQILYGEADAEDKTKPPTHYVSYANVQEDEELVTNVYDFPDVTSIRVSIVVRSPEANLVPVSETPKYILNGVEETPTADGRLRKVYTSTITIRNRVK